MQLFWTIYAKSPPRQPGEGENYLHPVHLQATQDFFDFVKSKPPSQWHHATRGGAPSYLSTNPSSSAIIRRV